MENNTEYEEVRISAEEMENVFKRILLNHGFDKNKSDILAKLFTNNSIDGVYSHGVNRFKPFIRHVQKKYIDTGAEPELVNTNGGIEQWNGNSGAGPLNALFCTDRSMELAKKHGIGCAALSNTNHWMRAGAYGWKAAQAGFAFICWTNTIPIMPAWGSKDSKLGNNPFVLAVPYNPEAIVLDMAMTLFSYGKMVNHKRRNEKLPFIGGYNKNGELTDDAAEIIDSLRPLPIGYWKGAGMSLLLDLLAAVLSGGLATNEIGKLEDEFGISQVFISIDLSKLSNYSSIQNTIKNIIDDYHESLPVEEKQKILYPGERVLVTREYNKVHGIPVSKGVWNNILIL